MHHADKPWMPSCVSFNLVSLDSKSFASKLSSLILWSYYSTLVTIVYSEISQFSRLKTAFRGSIGENTRKIQNFTFSHKRPAFITIIHFFSRKCDFTALFRALLACKTTWKHDYLQKKKIFLNPEFDIWFDVLLIFLCAAPAKFKLTDGAKKVGVSWSEDFEDFKI